MPKKGATEAKKEKGAAKEKTAPGKKGKNDKTEELNLRSSQVVPPDSAKVSAEWEGEDEEDLEGIDAYLRRLSQGMDVLPEEIPENISAEPVDPFSPRDVYDRIVEAIPSECITVSILLEAVVKQAAATLEIEVEANLSDTTNERDIIDQVNTNKSTFGGLNWGQAVPEKQTNLETTSDIYDKRRSANYRQQSLELRLQNGGGDACNSLRSSPLFNVPMFMKAGDFASIRSCHLSGALATEIAEGQITGDIRNVQGILWQKMPDFNKGLYLKLLGNLNHFMYYLPPGILKLDDMYYVLHLLMGAGIESYQRKQTEDKERKSKAVSFGSNKRKTASLTNEEDFEPRMSKDFEEKANRFPGTNLQLDRNYLAVSETTGLHFVVTPESNEEVTIVSFGHSKTTPNNAEAKPDLERSPSKETRGKGKKSGLREKSKITVKSKEEIKTESRKSINGDGEQNEKKTKKSKKSERENGLSQRGSENTGFARQNYPEETSRFAACEDQPIEDVGETSPIKSLLECPALSAINEFGVPDLSVWIEKYLVVKGQDEISKGDRNLVGKLEKWNFIEEFVPIQTIQMLNQACQDYSTLQQMYCPFYDTILLIFNNPVPRDLTAETQFQFELNTLPGLEHFLQFSMDTKRPLGWVEQVESPNQLDKGGQKGVNALLGIIPEDQWLNDPTVKFGITVDNREDMEELNTEAQVPNEEPGESVFYGTMEVYKSPIPSRVSSPFGGDLEPSISEANEEEEEEKSSERQSAGEVSGEKSQRNSAAVVVEDASNVRASSEMFPRKGSGKSISSKTSRKKSGTAKSDVSEKKRRESVRKSSVGANLERRVTAASLKSGGKDEEEESEQVSLEVNPSEDKSPRPPSPPLQFACYDFGKRFAIVNNETYYMYPMDGSIIKYDVNTIEPDLRMMQLTISKNGHHTYFYPYYIPPDFDLSSEDYVVCPYFHMVMNNGTIFAFHDRRAEESAPYSKMATILDKANSKPDLFSFERVLFGREVEMKLNEAAAATVKTPQQNDALEGGVHSDSKVTNVVKESKVMEPVEEPEPLEEKKRTSSTHSRHSSAKKRESKSSEKKVGKTEKGAEAPKKGGKKGKQKEKEKKPEKGKEKSLSVEPLIEEEEEEAPAPPDEYLTVSPDTEIQGEDYNPRQDGESVVTPAPPPSEADVVVDDWNFPSSDSDEEEEEEEKPERRWFFAPPWDDAVKLLEEMTHELTVTLPSGLTAKIEDIPGLPLVRIVKQYYEGKGSSKSTLEGSRYYTMDGSVIRFMLGGTIQILTARGVTTAINEIAANAKRDAENTFSAFGSASIVKIFNGDVILPNGQCWKIANGKKVGMPPISVFTTGQLAEGDIFRRRQDGVVFLHRGDGTVITHYPDGTRFTTKMVIIEPTPEVRKPETDKPKEDNTAAESAWTREKGTKRERKSRSSLTKRSIDYPPEVDNNDNMEEEPEQPEVADISDEDEFSDWVFVGLQYMIEHPNYATVLVNTLSGIIHLKLPCGEWLRVFANGSVRVNTEDKYSLDVDLNKAVLTYPPCSNGTVSVPTVTAIRLWHIANGEINPEETEMRRTSNAPVEKGELGQLRAEGDAKMKFAKSLHPKVKRKEEEKAREYLRQGALGRMDTTFDTSPDPVLNLIEETNVPKLKEDEMKGEGDFSDNVAIFVTNLDQLPEKKRPTLAEFLEFRDEFTLCKAVDSWNNRFEMDIHGATTVEEHGRWQEPTRRKLSCDELISTLSDYSNLSRDFVASLLRKKSRSDLENISKRFDIARESCTGMQLDSKIFVVKRDLSSFQYLQRDQVEDVLSKAYGSKDSTVVVDPAPNCRARKVVTIMRPVEEVQEPHGMWTKSYIEPLFRPATATNKTLRIASHSELRWFGYIVSSKKTATQGQSARKDSNFKKNKPSIHTLSGREEGAKSLTPEEMPLVPIYTAGLVITKSREKADGESQDEGSEAEAGKGEEGIDESEEEGEETYKEEAATPGGKKLTKKEKEKKEMKEEKKSKVAEKRDEINGEKGLIIEEENNESDEEEEEEDIFENVDPFDVDIGATLQTSKRKTKSFVEEASQGCLFSIAALRGLVDMENERRSAMRSLPKVIPMYHAQPSASRKKVLVIRSIAEIPKVDEAVQRALHSASQAYADTCKAQTGQYATYKLEDSRSPEERQKQMLYKQELIYQNIQEMHLHEQKPGKAIKFLI